MKRFFAVVDKLNSGVGFVSYILLFMLVLTIYEVTARFAFGHATVWVHETVVMLYSFYIIIGAGYATLRKLDIRVDVLWSRWSRKKQAIADLTTSIFAFIFVLIFLWFSARFAWTSIEILERSDTPFRPPVYPLKASIPIGVFLLLLQLVATTARNIRTAFKGNENV